jgi:hypothetical protein
MKKRIPHVRALLAAASMAMAAGPVAWAAGSGCAAYKWDVTPEVKLYGTTPAILGAGGNPESAAEIQAGRLYALQLQPQQNVHYAVAPSKKMLPDGAFGGILRLKVPNAGQYRIAIDSGFWLDVIHDGKPLATVDFNGSSTCDGPHKIVVFDFPANAELLLQLSAASTAQAKPTVTAVAQAH